MLDAGRSVAEIPASRLEGDSIVGDTRFHLLSSFPSCTWERTLLESGIIINPKILSLCFSITEGHRCLGTLSLCNYMKFIYQWDVD